MTTARTQPTIDPMRPDDFDAVRAIFAEGIATGNATFETEPFTSDEFETRFLPQCRLAAREGERVVGWAALVAYSSRPAYRGVAEVSVYVAASARGRGIGEALLRAVIVASEREGFWTLQAGIFPENEPSVRLHERCSFRVVGTRERIGALAGRWRDVVLLERRSTS